MIKSIKFENGIQEIEINEDKVNEVIEDSKWSIGSTMAPVYYNTLRNVKEAARQYQRAFGQVMRI